MIAWRGGILTAECRYKRWRVAPCRFCAGYPILLASQPAGRLRALN